VTQGRAIFAVSSDGLPHLFDFCYVILSASHEVIGLLVSTRDPKHLPETLSLKGLDSPGGLCSHGPAFTAIQQDGHHEGPEQFHLLTLTDFTAETIHVHY
jgi:hypothetical protein